MIDLTHIEKLKNVKSILSKIISEKYGIETKEEFQQVINKCYSTTLAAKMENSSTSHFAKHVYREFLNELNTMKDIDFDKEVKLLSKALNKASFNK